MVHTLRDWVAALAAAATALLAPIAEADEPPGAKPQTAAALLDQAVAAMDAGKLEESLVALRAALCIKPTRETACNIGFVAGRLGNWLEAAEHLATCLRDAPPPVTDQERDQRATEVMDLVSAARHLAVLTFDVTPEGAEIFVDDRFVGRAPLREGVFVEPGPHLIKAEKSRGTAKTMVTATEGTAHPVHLTVVAQEGAPPAASSREAGPLAPRRSPAPAPLPRPTIPSTTIAKLLAGASGVGIGVGVATLIAKGILEARVEEALVTKVQSDGTRCEKLDEGEGAVCAQIGSDLLAAKNLGVAAPWAFIGAGAALAGSIVAIAVPLGREGRVKVVGDARGVFLTGAW
jgi:hypothetical protein